MKGHRVACHWGTQAGEMVEASVVTAARTILGGLLLLAAVTKLAEF